MLNKYQLPEWMAWEFEKGFIEVWHLNSAIKKRQTSFKMTRMICAKRERCQQENSSGSMMLERVEMGGEAIVQDFLQGKWKLLVYAELEGTWSFTSLPSHFSNASLSCCPNILLLLINFSVPSLPHFFLSPYQFLKSSWKASTSVHVSPNIVGLPALMALIFPHSL